MTVQELINKLNEFDLNREVVLYVESQDYEKNIDRIVERLVEINADPITMKMLKELMVVLE